MAGNKKKLFCLLLSLVGWFLLSSIVLGVVLSLFAVVFVYLLSPSHMLLPVDLFLSQPSAVAFLTGSLISLIICAAVTAPVAVYMSTASAIFYDILAGRGRTLSADAFPEVRQAEAGAFRDAGADAWRREANADPDGDLEPGPSESDARADEDGDR